MLSDLGVGDLFCVNTYSKPIYSQLNDGYLLMTTTYNSTKHTLIGVFLGLQHHPRFQENDRLYFYTADYGVVWCYNCGISSLLLDYNNT